jgi:hypothetical protein
MYEVLGLTSSITEKAFNYSQFSRCAYADYIRVYLIFEFLSMHLKQILDTGPLVESSFVKNYL